MSTDRILDLEHDGNEYVPAMFPLGEDPDHCAWCRHAFWSRHEQALCPHPDDDVERVEITTWGEARRRLLSHCGLCGKPMGDA